MNEVVKLKLHTSVRKFNDTEISKKNKKYKGENYA